jgi:hypothetical protein
MPMHDDTHVSERSMRSKATVIATLRAARLDPTTIALLEHELRDPVDLAGDGGTTLLAYGITIDGLIDRFGGSP